MAHRVILADDSVAIHRVVNLTFTGEDVEIVSVHNGTDAIRKANEQTPDLVIADIFMPGLNGYDVCARLRQHSATRTVPVILLVGAFESFDPGKASEVGATAHIMKPIEPQSLLKMVNFLLNQPRNENNPATSERYGVGSSDGRSTDFAHTRDQQPGATNTNRPQISLTDDTGNESGQMERFINSLQPPATKPQEKPPSREFFNESKEPVRVFNLSEPEPVNFVEEKPVQPKKFIGQEDLVAHLSGEISSAEQSDIENQAADDNAESPVGIRTDEFESQVVGLVVLSESDSETHQDQESANVEQTAEGSDDTAKAIDNRPVANTTLVSPELVNEISERVVTRLRERLREEVTAAIEDALNQYLKDLE